MAPRAHAYKKRRMELSRNKGKTKQAKISRSIPRTKRLKNADRLWTRTNCSSDFIFQHTGLHDHHHHEHGEHWASQRADPLYPAILHFISPISACIIYIYEIKKLIFPIPSLSITHSPIVSNALD